MASYGKLEYWNERYARETEPSEWIGGIHLVEALLKPEILSFASAPAPGGTIGVTSLCKFPHPLYPADDFMSYEYEIRQEERMDNVKCSFPKRQNVRVLNVGCGNSELGASLLKKGFNNIVNVDYSSVLIEKMKEKYNHDFFVELHSCIKRENLLRHSLGLKPKCPDEHCELRISPTGDSRRESRDEISVGEDEFPNMTFELGDISKGLDHPDESFDLIICKKTLDIVLCGAASISDARKMMTECYRLLNKEHGVMIILSSAKPEDRAVFFECDPWSGVMHLKLRNRDDDQLKKGHEKKKVESYCYILYKQQPRV